ncbi:MAG: M23 family metallopeptidase [Anaerolineae bacterium]|nr:M23 family metallopeptidase [Anaerolineae bacterium]
MQRDEFLKPLEQILIMTMLAVKAFVVIVFVFTVLALGLKNLNRTPVYSSSIMYPPNSIGPLEDVTLGLSEMPTPTPIPTMLPTFTFTPTLLPTNTTEPTGTSTATIEPTSTLAATETSQPTSTSMALISPTLKPTATPYPTLTPTPFGAATQTVSALTGIMASPLQGVAASDLFNVISQPFIMPPAGEDSGHHGVDFAYWDFKDVGAIEGTPILSVFPGKVSSAYTKIRNPYGYMVMVETPLSNLPQEIIDAIKLPEASSTPANPSNRLTCPTGFADWWDPNTKSLYVLYGHLGNIPTVKLGQTVKMGDMLGVVGNSGASSSPHLHFEMRIGPANATFASMGHYETTTTDQERHNYCSWRISGQFEIFDPIVLYGGSAN